MTYDEALDHILSDLPAFLEATEDALCEALTTDAQIHDYFAAPVWGQDKKIAAAKVERDRAKEAAEAMLRLAKRHLNGPEMYGDYAVIGRLMAHFVEKAATRMAEGVR